MIGVDSIAKRLKNILLFCPSIMMLIRLRLAFICIAHRGQLNYSGLKLKCLGCKFETERRLMFFSHARSTLTYIFFAKISHCWHRRVSQETTLSGFIIDYFMKVGKKRLILSLTDKSNLHICLQQLHNWKVLDKFLFCLSHYIKRKCIHFSRMESETK